MTISVFSAARYLCEKSGWTLSNLKLQKILFLAHMVHLGQNEKPLLDEGFEAWDYGPVLPNLYHHVKAFGSSPIRNVFRAFPVPTDEAALSALDSVYDQVSGWSAGKLVRVSHRRDGAWDKSYIPGAIAIPIEDEEILREYKMRLAASHKEAA